METYLIGVDTSKHNFQVCRVTRDGRKTFERTVTRSQGIGVLTGYPGAKVALEVGSGAHFLGPNFETLSTALESRALTIRSSDDIFERVI